MDVHVKRLREALGAGRRDGGDGARRRLPHHRATGGARAAEANAAAATPDGLSHVTGRVLASPVAARRPRVALGRCCRRGGARPSAWPRAPVAWFTLDSLRAPRCCAGCARRLARHAARRAACGARRPTARARALRRARAAGAGCASAGCEDFLDAHRRPRPTAWCCWIAQGRIEWCNQTAAAHFGLDPERDLQQYIVQPGARPRLRRLSTHGGNYSARRGHAGARQLGRARRRSCRCTCIPTARAAAAAVARRHRGGTGRGDAPRLRGQRLARDPHAADGAGGLRRDAADPAAATRGARALPATDGAAGRSACRRWSATC